jgi:hypothetical protein
MHMSFCLRKKKGNPIMATVRSLDGALDFEPRTSRGFFRSIALYWSALREGATAARAYEALTRQGATHEEAVARIMKEHFGRR